MSAEQDDEALSWSGADDPTHLNQRDGAQAAEVQPREPHTAGDGSGVLVFYGVFGGAFLIYVFGWIVALRRPSSGSSGLLAEALDRLGQFLAVVSPVLWFFGVLLLVPATRIRTRILLLALGAVLLAPWPLVLGLVG